MVYKEGNKFCEKCNHANVSTRNDLDLVVIKYEPTYDNPTCHYCEHCYEPCYDNKF